MTPGEMLRRMMAWARRGRLERELAAELDEHLARLVRDLEHGGLAPADALAAARRQLGNRGRIREESRDSWGLQFIEALLQDLRHAARALRRTPGFTAAVIVTLALGIGATTAIYSVVHGVLLRPLPLAHEDRLVTFCEQYPGSTPDWCSVSPPNVEDILARSHTIEAAGIARGWESHLTTPDGARLVASGIATPGAFAALGARVVRGRMITDADLVGRESDVALVSWEMWQNRLNADPGIIGRTLMLDDHPVRVVGVLERGFQVPEFESLELWRPVHINPRDEQNRDWRGFVAYARLKAGVTRAQARADLAATSVALKREHFETTPGWGITMTSLRDLIVGNVRSRLLLFLGAVGLVLLIACANVTNLLLARGAVHAREMAARAALGAGPARIVRALLVESLLLATAGAAAGIAIALGAVRAFRTLAPSGMPRVADVSVDGGVLTFAAVLAVGVAVVVGIVPARRAVRMDLSQALREGGRTGTGRRSPLGSALVAFELSMAFLLIAGAAALTRSFAAFNAWQPGFDHDHVLLFSLSPTAARYDSGRKVAALWDRVEGALATIPGVTGVGTASAGPLFGGRETWEMELQGIPPEQKASIRWTDVGPGYFRALGVPLTAGRALNAGDAIGAPLVCLVNEALARRYWPGVDPVGRTIVMPTGTERTTFTVVGVVRDVPALSPGAVVEPAMYWSNRQEPRIFSWVLLRTRVPPASITGAVRARIAGVDRDMTMGTPRTMDDALSEELNAPRFSMLLLQSFGIVALTLAAVGTYGLLAYLVTLRRREIGIRMALGARRRGIVRDVIVQGLRLVMIGIGAGLVVFLGIGRAIATLAPGISLGDPLSLAPPALLLTLVAVAACAIPALRAGTIDPVRILGVE